MSLDSRFEGKEGSSHFEACELVIPLLEKMGIPFFLPLPLVELLFAPIRARLSLDLGYEAQVLSQGVGSNNPSQTNRFLRMESPLFSEA